MVQTDLKIRVDLDEMVDIDLDSPVKIPTPPVRPPPIPIPSQKKSFWKQITDLFSSVFYSTQPPPDQPACTRS